MQIFLYCKLYHLLLKTLFVYHKVIFQCITSYRGGIDQTDIYLVWLQMALREVIFYMYNMYQIQVYSKMSCCVVVYFCLVLQSFVLSTRG